MYGVGPAFAELSLVNSVQVIVGAVVSLALSQAILRTYPEIQFLKPRRERKDTEHSDSSRGRVASDHHSGRLYESEHFTLVARRP